MEILFQVVKFVLKYFVVATVLTILSETFIYVPYMIILLKFIISSTFFPTFIILQLLSDNGTRYKY